MTASTPVSFGTYPPGASFGPRSSGTYEFVWILRGSALWRTEGRIAQEIVLRPGQLALARPRTTDSYHWDPEVETVHGYVHFAVADPGPLPKDEDWPLVRSLTRPAVLEGLCQHLVQLAGRSGDAAPQRSDRLLAVLLEVFVTDPVERAGDPLPAAVRTSVEAVRREWQHGLSPVPVPVLAAAAGVSPGHLFRVFRSTYGCSPARALEAVRLARAATLLQRTNATLAEIAHRCGFANPYHFSRRFSTAYGGPPGAYRTQGGVQDPYEPVRRAGLLPVAHALLDAEVSAAP